MKRFFIYLFLFCVCLYSYLGAYSGTYSVGILKFNPDSVSLSCGGSIFTDCNVVNPAGSGEISRPKTSFSYLLWAEDVRYSYLSVLFPFKESRLGFSFGYLTYGNIEGYDVSGFRYELPSSYDLLAVFTYAKSIENIFHLDENIGYLGVNLKFVDSHLVWYSASSFALDLSCVLNVGSVSEVLNLWRLYRLFSPLKISVGCKNIGGGLKYLSDVAPLPFVFDIGLKYDIEFVSMMFGYSFSRGDSEYSFGISFKPFSYLSLRGGYKYSGESINNGFTFGVGLEAGFLSFNYACQQFRDFSTLFYSNLVHQISVNLDLRGLYEWSVLY